MWRGPAWVTVVRDLVLLALPSVAFIIEALKDKPSVELLIVYMTLAASPGLLGAVTMARGGRGGIEPPSSPPQPPLSPPPSSPSPSSSSPSV